MSNNFDILFSPKPSTYAMESIEVRKNGNYIAIGFGGSTVFLTPEAFDRLLFEMKSFDLEMQVSND